MNPRHHAFSALAAAAGAVLVLATGCSTSATSPVGTWGEDTSGSPSLTFAEDGTVSGTDGCNRLAGSWTQDGDTLDFGGSLISTLMACEDVDTWLSGITTATVDGDTLTALDADGAALGTLERTADR